MDRTERHTLAAETRAALVDRLSKVAVLTRRAVRDFGEGRDGTVPPRRGAALPGAARRRITDWASI